MSIPFEDFKTDNNPSQNNMVADLLENVIPKAEEKVQIVVMSGARGSGKTVAMQFIINWMCVNYPKLEVKLSRISIKEIKNTFFKELKEMTPDRILKSNTAEKMIFLNDSNISCFGFGDGNVRKIRGNNTHIWVMEEVTEDALKDGYSELNHEALKEISMVVRNPNGPNIIFMLCNPEDEENWVYREYIAKAGYVDGLKQKIKDDTKENVHIYYSITSDNPHLKPEFIPNLRATLTPRACLRYIQGQWISILGETLYDYDPDLHYVDSKYVIDQRHPIHISFDFNTAKNAPASTVVFQHIDGVFHFFKEFVMEGTNTFGMMDEICESGILDYNCHYIINGDATGYAKKSSAESNDYDIIEDYLINYKIKLSYDIEVPKSNPPIKSRHNLVNRYLKNSNGLVRVQVYKDAPTAARGLKSTVLRKGAQYKEREDPWQHITTAMGYGIHMCTLEQGGISEVKW